MPEQQEVVVTAAALRTPTDRAPISVAVWSRDDLDRAGIKGITSLASLTPGVEFDRYTDRANATNIALRGVNGWDGTVVSVYLDDVPLPVTSGSPGGFSSGSYSYRTFPVLFDMDRVEVLRGPQGALFGQGALAGVVRFTTQPPDLIRHSGVASAELSATARGGMNHEAGVAFGGPLVTDRVGFRLAGWRRKDGGYVDRIDPFTGVTVDAEANRSLSDLFRGALLVAVTDTLRAIASVTYQSVSSHDDSSFYTYLSDPEAGVLRSGRLLQQPSSDKFWLASLKIAAELPSSELTAVGAYFYRDSHTVEDDTNAARQWDNPLGPEYPVDYSDAISMTAAATVNRFSEEVRLRSAGHDLPFSWLLGVFLAQERDQENDSLVAADPAVNGGPDYALSEQRRTEAAVFGSAELRVSQPLSLKAGARVSRYDFDYLLRYDGPDTTLTWNPFHAAGVERVVTPQFGVDFRPAEEQLFYATVAKGYRPGGVNLPFQRPSCGPPVGNFGPDSAWSYELGGKNLLFGGRIQLNTSLYYVDWHDVQLLTTLQPTRCLYIANVGRAASRGFELELVAGVTTGLKAALSVAYSDATYTQTVRNDAGLLIVAAGDAVGNPPLIPAPWDFRASIDYFRPLGYGLSSYIRVDDEFRTHHPGPFNLSHPDAVGYSPTRDANPATNLLNMRAGLQWSRFDVAFFVNNLLDAQPTLLRRNYYPTDTLYFATTFRPRTIGLSGSVQF